ncbi:MAG: hypothetical protein HXX11_10725 [Desulfuromonadales bacterium]|nr:hypothetical protein [Desulfuromonadales bacterium]
MSYEAKVFRVLIASPSDVIDEREIAVKTIQEWNDLNSPERRIVILPLRWETHTAPEYGSRPQDVINRQVVDHCDLVIGIFWTRIGSPTGVADSGTLEEIERVASQGKPVMLYFSQVKKDPNLIELDQLAKLREFKEKTFPNALVESFLSQIEFRDKLAKQIEIQLRTLVATEAQATHDGRKTAGSEIELEFCDIETGNPIGKELQIKSTFLNVSDIESVPDFVNNDDSKSKGSLSSLLYSRKNRDYYKEYVEYLVNAAMLQQIAFALTNNGVIGARDIFIDMKVITNISNLTVSTNTKLKVKKPEKERDSSISISFDDIDGFGGASLAVAKQNDAWVASLETRALQPKRNIKSKYRMIVGGTSSGRVDIVAKIYADILPEPLIQKLHIDIAVEQIDIQAMELLRKNNVIASKPRNDASQGSNKAPGKRVRRVTKLIEDANQAVER